MSNGSPDTPPSHIGKCPNSSLYPMKALYIRKQEGNKRSFVRVGWICMDCGTVILE